VAGQFIEFLRSAAVQQALQTSMWMFPAEAGAPRVEVMRRHASEPQAFSNPPAELASERSRAWQERWTRVVLK
jgi:thiamine transport system substrate-binding protein